MIVVDASAVIAIVLREADAAHYSRALEAANGRLISAATVVEIGVVLAAKNQIGAEEDVFALLSEAEIRVQPVDRDQARLAIQAYQKFGKKRGHPAQLNFGDCFSYALAQSAGRPLLYKGSEFSHTDIRSVL